MFRLLKNMVKMALFLLALWVLYQLYLSEKAKESSSTEEDTTDSEEPATNAEIVAACKSAAADLKGIKALSPSAYAPALKLRQSDWARFKLKYPYYDSMGYSWSWRYAHQGRAWKKSSELLAIKAEFDKRESW